MRERILEAAVALARAAGLDNLATVEFLVDADGGEDAAFAFIEANPRLQVEHTVTEEVTGLDLVRLQLELAAGRTLAALGLGQGEVPAPRGMAMQVRINMETMASDGTARPAGGTLTAFELPSGPGIRVDTFGYAGYRTSPRFDSLLAKLIVSSRSAALADVAAKAYRALCELKIAGVPTNAPFLQSLLRHPELLAGRLHTGFVEEHMRRAARAGRGGPPAPVLRAAGLVAARSAPGSIRTTRSRSSPWARARPARRTTWRRTPRRRRTPARARQRWKRPRTRFRSRPPCRARSSA